MAIVALLICTAFVFYLLTMEKRASRSLSWALWIPTVWMMILASRPLVTWFNSTRMTAQPIVNNESGSALDRWTLIAMGIAAIVVLIHRRFNWSGTLRRHRWLVVLLTYMLVSTFWSEIPMIALKRWAHEWITLVMAVLVISEADPLQALASVFRRSGYVLLPFSVVLIKYYPALGRQYGRWSGVEMWTGVTRQKNQLGQLCMVIIFFLLFSLYERWQGRPTVAGRHQAWADSCVIAIGLYLLIGSHSATSLATLAVGIAAFLGLRWLQKRRSSISQLGLQACVVFLLVYGVSMPFFGGSSAAAFTSILGRDSTLTGRTEVWASVMPARDERPLLGYGFGSFWTDARRALYEIPTAHNGYLDILLELGEAGLVLYTFWLLSCAYQLHRLLRQQYEWASFAICLLLMSLIYNSTESALNSFTEYITAVVVLACFTVPAQLRSKTSSMNPIPLDVSAQPLPLVDGMDVRSW